MVTCLLSKIDKYQEKSFQQALNVSWGVENPLFLEAILSQVTKQDCINPLGQSVAMEPKSRYELKVFDWVCSTQYNCPHLFCEDTTCLTPENSCIIWCKERYFFILKFSTQKLMKFQGLEIHGNSDDF